MYPGHRTCLCAARRALEHEQLHFEADESAPKPSSILLHSGDPSFAMSHGWPRVSPEHRAATDLSAKVKIAHARIRRRVSSSMKSV